QQLPSPLPLSFFLAAADDEDSTTAGVTITRDAAAGVLANDGGTGLTVTAYSTIPSGKGTLTIAANGGYTFVPAAGFSGTVTANYTATDGVGQTDSATLTIVVTPVANGDSGTTPAGAAISWTQAELVNDDLGTGLETTAVTQPANGSVTLEDDGSVTYTPAAGFSGVDTFTYTVADEDGSLATAIVTVTVTPTAADDNASTPGGTPITVNAEDGVLGNDVGTGVEVVDFEAPDAAHGTLVLNPDGSYTFTPVQGWHGTVEVEYTIEDENGEQATATLTIVVGDDLPLVVTTLESVCRADVPWLVWDMDLPAGFPDQGATPLTITFINPDGEDHVISGLALEGDMLWPGASDTDPQQWPGWVQNPDGSYSPTDGNFGWTRDGVDVLFKVNPEITELVHYPPATALCASPPPPEPPLPTAAHDDATTTGGTPITVSATNGVLANDTGTDITVVDYEQPDPAQGHLTLNPDGSFTFTPVQGWHGTVTVGYTIEDENGNQVSATLTIVVGPDLPLVVDTEPYGACVADVPYLRWNLSLPAGFPDQGATPVTITFINPDGDDYVVTGLPLQGEMLWPGASATAPKQWPGWKQLDDGTYVESDGNFAWTRDGVQVKFSVNPEITTTIGYPPATPTCATAPETAPEPEDPPTDSLSHTGADSVGLLPFAGLLFLAGIVLIVIARKRREDEDEQLA
ncbi:MAG: Ig-like domain-containing protein, partial [Actinomycetota bacterium]